MARDPWTGPHPQPGDFDAELAAIDPRDLQVVEPGSGAKVTLVVGIESEDAVRLERLPAARGKKPSDVVAELVRDADRPAASRPLLPVHTHMKSGTTGAGHVRFAGRFFEAVYPLGKRLDAWTDSRDPQMPRLEHATGWDLVGVACAG
jgi:hypothetical protein